MRAPTSQSSLVANRSSPRLSSSVKGTCHLNSAQPCCYGWNRRFWFQQRLSDLVTSRSGAMNDRRRCCSCVVSSSPWKRRSRTRWVQDGAKSRSRRDKPFSQIKTWRLSVGCLESAAVLTRVAVGCIWDWTPACVFDAC